MITVRTMSGRHHRKAAVGPAKRYRPSWSAHHYLALVKLWKQAEKIGDRKLQLRIERATRWLLRRPAFRVTGEAKR